MRVFLSYSHREFHIAHQLAEALRKEGFDPWFDAERLAPGSDWIRSIDEAIDDADALVLLASPSAVGSGHVIREWRRAMGRTPVYVAVARNVGIPAELAGRPVVDLRRRFGTQVRLLAGALRDPGVGLYKVRRRAGWPLPVLWIAFALAFDFVAVLAYLAQGALKVAAEDGPLSVGSGSWTAAIGIPVACSAFLIYFGSLLRGFARRRFRYWSIFVALVGSVEFFSLIGNLISGLVDAMLHGQLQVDAFRSTNGYFAGYHVVTLLIMLPVNLVALVCLTRSGAAFRWLPSGEAPERVRRRFVAPIAGRADGPSRGRATTFAVRCSDGDQAIGEEIGREFRSARFTETDEDPDVVLVVVSNAAEWAPVTDQLRSGRAIAVLAASVRLPEEADDWSRFQWVDYRGRQPEKIGELARSLRDPNHAPPATVPAGFDRFVAPPQVSAAITTLVALFALFFGAAVLSVTVAQDNPEERHPVPLVESMIPDPNAVAPDGRHKSFEEVWCERLGWPTTSQPGFPDCGLVKLLPRRDALPWERPKILNPKYADRFPDNANTLLVVRAVLAGVAGFLLLAGAWLIGRRKVRTWQLSIVIVAALVVVAAWIALAIPSREQSPLLLTIYVAGWGAAAVIAHRHRPQIAQWLPAKRSGTRAAVAPSLIQLSIPVILLALTRFYASGLLL